MQHTPESQAPQPLIAQLRRLLRCRYGGLLHFELVRFLYHVGVHGFRIRLIELPREAWHAQGHQRALQQDVVEYGVALR